MGQQTHSVEQLLFARPAHAQRAAPGPHCLGPLRAGTDTEWGRCVLKLGSSSHGMVHDLEGLRGSCVRRGVYLHTPQETIQAERSVWGAAAVRDKTS